MLAITMLIALVLGTVIAIPFEANASNETLVYKNDFSSSVGKWEKFGTTAGTLRIENGALKMSSHTKTWHSPALDLYSMVKATGTGTYWVKLTVSYTGTTDVANEARLLIRGNGTNSFLAETNGNYYKSISSVYKTVPDKGMVLYGSFKMLKEDFLERYSSKLLLCVDGIPAGAGVSVSIDDVEVYRLDDTQITNGDFKNKLVGWRPWCSKGEDILEVNGLSKFNYYYGNYIRAKNYGSIACNIDQILAYYGMGEYLLSFEFCATTIDEEGCNKFSVYMSRGTSDYHKRIGNIYSKSTPQVYTFVIDVTHELYNNLHPQQNEVFFRIEYKGDTDTEITYNITNVVLAPKKLESFDVAMLDAGERVWILNRGQDADERTTGVMNLINATPTNAPATCSYISSDTSVVTVDERGLVTPVGGGVATITVTSHNNNITKQWTVAVNNESNKFIKVNQERSGWCWLACAKMLAYNYAQRKDTSFRNDSLRNTFVAVKPEANIEDYKQRTGTILDKQNAINYFLNGQNANLEIKYNALSTRDLINLIDENKIAVMDFDIYIGDTTRDVGHSSILYGYKYVRDEETGAFSFYILYYDTTKATSEEIIPVTYDSMLNHRLNDKSYEWIRTQYLD